MSGFPFIVFDFYRRVSEIQHAVSVASVDTKEHFIHTSKVVFTVLLNHGSHINAYLDTKVIGFLMLCFAIFFLVRYLKSKAQKHY